MGNKTSKRRDDNAVALDAADYLTPPIEINRLDGVLEPHQENQLFSHIQTLSSDYDNLIQLFPNLQQAQDFSQIQYLQHQLVTTQNELTQCMDLVMTSFALKLRFSMSLDPIFSLTFVPIAFIPHTIATLIHALQLRYNHALSTLSFIDIAPFAHPILCECLNKTTFFYTIHATNPPSLSLPTELSQIVPGPEPFGSLVVYLTRHRTSLEPVVPIELLLTSSTQQTYLDDTFHDSIDLNSLSSTNANLPQGPSATTTIPMSTTEQQPFVSNNLVFSIPSLQQQQQQQQQQSQHQQLYQSSVSPPISQQFSYSSNPSVLALPSANSNYGFPSPKSSLNTTATAMPPLSHQLSLPTPSHTSPQ